MHPKIQVAVQWFREINLKGIAKLVESNDTAFLSFICIVAAIDALSGYRFENLKDGERFEMFVTSYFPIAYHSHASSLYKFRCRMLHNFSPAYFSLTHATPSAHLTESNISDVILDDGSFFKDFAAAAEQFIAELQKDANMQAIMLRRLGNLERGGAFFIS